jgi:hypothetical protein
MIIDQELIFATLYEICQRIEICGASLELTNAVSLTGDLMSAVGNKSNTPDSYALKRVQEAIKDSVML